jgi:hypothetical protein
LQEISIEDYTYDLPPGRVARFPLPRRDDARLLVHDAGGTRDATFRELPGLLHPGDTLVFNDTRVIRARGKNSCHRAAFFRGGGKARGSGAAPARLDGDAGIYYIRGVSPSGGSKQTK